MSAHTDPGAAELQGEGSEAAPVTRHERLDLGAIRDRVTAATPGPWTALHRHVGLTADDDETAGLGLEIEGPPEAWNRGQFARGADATFIAHARQDVPALLAAIERVLDLHSGSPGWCDHCVLPLPCPTIRALGGTDD